MPSIVYNDHYYNPETRVIISLIEVLVYVVMSPSHIYIRSRIVALLLYLSDLRLNYTITVMVTEEMRVYIRSYRIIN